MEELTQEELQEERDQIALEVFEGAEKPVIGPEENEDVIVDKVEEDVQKVEEVPQISPALQSMIDNMNAEAIRREERLKQTESRIGSLQQQLHKANEAVAAISSAPTPEEIAEASKTKKEWEELKKEFPEWGKGVDKRISETDKKLSDTDKRLQSAIEELQSRIPNVDEIQGNVLTQAEQARINRISAKTKEDVIKLYDEYPDFMTINKSAEFNEWIAAQPLSLRIRRESDNLADALEVMEKYKDFQENGSVTARRNNRLSSAVTQKKGTTPRSKSVGDMTPAEERAYIAAKVFND